MELWKCSADGLENVILTGTCIMDSDDHRGRPGFVRCGTKKGWAERPCQVIQFPGQLLPELSGRSGIGGAEPLAQKAVVDGHHGSRHGDRTVGLSPAVRKGGLEIAAERSLVTVRSDQLTVAQRRNLLKKLVPGE